MIFKRIYEFILEVVNKNKLFSINLKSYGPFKIAGPSYLINGLSDEEAEIYFRSIKYILKTVFNKDSLYVIMDIGGSIGQSSLVFCRLKDSKILSFEPNPDSYRLFSENISRNNIENIQLFKFGLYDENKESVFGSPKNISLFKLVDKSSLGMKTVFTDKGDVTIDLKRGDKLNEINELSELNLVKLDVEGSEIHALKGLEKTINKHKPIILCEISNYCMTNAGYSIDYFISYILELEYKYVVNFTDITRNNWKDFTKKIKEFNFSEIGAEDYLFFHENHIE